MHPAQRLNGSPPRCVLARMPSRRLAVALVFAASAVAQAVDPPRGKALGLVTDAAGAPVAGADVVLWSWPLPERIDLGAPDRVTVSTAANGRFAAAILDGRSYSAHAAWQDAKGHHVTTLASDVLPGVPCLLREAPPRTCTGIELRGGDGLHRWGALRVELVVGDSNPLVRVLPLDGARQAVLPADLPVGPTWIDVRAANGQLLRSVPLAAAATSPAVVEIADPFTTTLTVLGDAGQRLAAAEIHVLHDYGYFGVSTGRRVRAPDLLGRTGADGTFVVTLPTTHPVDGPSPNRALLLVSAAGHQRQSVDVVTAKAGPGDRLTTKLRAGSDLRVRFVGPDGAAVTSGLVPLYESDAQVESRHAAGGFLPLPPLPMRPEPDGSFVGVGVHTVKGARVFALVDAAHVGGVGLPLQAGFGVPPLLPIAQTRPPKLGLLDLGDVPFAGLAPARFVVVDAEGAPVAAARLRLWDDGGFPTPLDFRCDRVGRLQVPLPAGAWHVGAYGAGGGVAVASVDVPDDVRGTGRVELRLGVPRVVRGTVTNGGAPVPADARVVVTAGDGVPRDLAQIAHAVLTATPVAADGTFAVRVPFGDARWQLRVATGSGSAQTAGPGLVVQVDERDLDGVTLSVAQ